MNILHVYVAILLQKMFVLSQKYSPYNCLVSLFQMDICNFPEHRFPIADYPLDLPILQLYYPLGMLHEAGSVGNKYDGPAILFIDIVEQLHNLIAGFGIQVAGWLIRKYD